jgi:hypothetical protein
VALSLFMVVVTAHLAEHIAQAYQIWGLGLNESEARGVLGLFFPVLLRGEWLHYSYALQMFAGLALLRPGFVGRARLWWTIALALQGWHHLEHLLLLLQWLTGTFLFGRSGPTSILQLIFPTVELHLFYNTVVFVPMVIALYRHIRPDPSERDQMSCRCAVGVASTSHP